MWPELAAVWFGSKIAMRGGNQPNMIGNAVTGSTLVICRLHDSAARTGGILNNTHLTEGTHIAVTDDDLAAACFAVAHTLFQIVHHDLHQPLTGY